MFCMFGAFNDFSMITTRYVKDQDIIYVERTSEIGLQEILAYIKSFDHDFKNFKDLYILDDFRDSISLFNKGDYPIMIQGLEKRLNRYDQVKHAVLVHNPSDTALSILFEMISKVLINYSYKTFSTEGAAISWLK